MQHYAIDDVVDDIARMVRSFVRCNIFSIVDKLANATGKEVAEQALYEALRASRSAQQSGNVLCEVEQGKTIKPYIAREESIAQLLKLLDTNIVEGLDVCKKIAVKALSIKAPLKPSPKESRSGEG